MGRMDSRGESVVNGILLDVPIINCFQWYLGMGWTVGKLLDAILSVASHGTVVWDGLPSYPGALSWEKCAWYPLFAHARNFPAFHGLWISLCDVRNMMTSIHTRGCIIKL